MRQTLASTHSVGESCFPSYFFLQLTTTFIYPGSISGGDIGLYFYDIAWRMFGASVLLKWHFLTHCTHVIFLPVPVRFFFAVALWGDMEAGALETIKQCSAILVKPIFLIVTYTGDLVALLACLDHQKRTKQSHDIWTHPARKLGFDILPNMNFKGSQSAKGNKVQFSLLFYP